MEKLNRLAAELERTLSGNRDAACVARSQSVLLGHRALLEYDRRVRDVSHSLRSVADLHLGADNAVVISVRERVGREHKDAGEEVDARTFAACVIKSNVLHLSFGPLFSSVPNRRYYSEKVYPVVPVLRSDGTPELDGNGRPRVVTGPDGYDALGVDGRGSLHVTGAALLNYRLPIGALDRKPLNFLLAAGPTFRFDGQEQSASRIGFFAGVSASFWRRLYVTPGIHLSQYTDFPTGLAPGSLIPGGYPQQQLASGTKNWTAKFGVALSFRTNSFEGLDVGLSAPAPASSAAKEPKSANAEAAPAPTVPAADGAGNAPAEAGGGMNPATESGDRDTGEKAQASEDKGVLGSVNENTTSNQLSPPQQTTERVGGRNEPSLGPVSGETSQPVVNNHRGAFRAIAEQAVVEPALTFGDSVRFEGSACPVDGPKPIHSPDPKKQSLFVAWGEAFSLSLPPADATKPATAKSQTLDCQIRATLQIPAGYQAALRGVEYEGEFDLGPKQQGSIRVEMALISSHGATIVLQSSAERTGPTSLRVAQSDSSARSTWSPCGGSATLVLRVLLTGKPAAGTLGLEASVRALSIRSIDPKHVEYRPCPAL